MKLNKEIGQVLQESGKLQGYLLDLYQQLDNDKFVYTPRIPRTNSNDSSNASTDREENIKQKVSKFKDMKKKLLLACDGGKERQAAYEAINVIDSFFEEILHGKDENAKAEAAPNKLLNKKIRFTYADCSDDEDEDGADEEVNKLESHADSNANSRCPGNGKSDCREEEQRTTSQDKAEKSVDKLIEAELEELGDKNKRRFVKLDSGCNGLVFMQMRRRDGDLGPKEIVQHTMESAASTRKHMSRFMLRVLPVLVTCYASEEEISIAIKPTIAWYFPAKAETPGKFSVLYDTCANTSIDMMKIIDAVVKSMPGPHQVDLKDPVKSIVVQIVKTVCLIGVVEKYKELAKYNMRQLTSPKAWHLYTLLHEPEFLRVPPMQVQVCWIFEIYP
ncbi:hypothetical protein Ancab_037781 [Ancistrocladus abbreviatus]